MLPGHKNVLHEKIKEMVASRHPWEGTRWIKDSSIPKVPQIKNTNGDTINELDSMFNVFFLFFILQKYIDQSTKLVQGKLKGALDYPITPNRYWGLPDIHVGMLKPEALWSGTNLRGKRGEEQGKRGST